MKTEWKEYTWEEKKDHYKKETEVSHKLREAVESLKHTARPNKRLETKAKQLLPEYNVFYNNDGFHLHLYVWGNGINYNQRYSLLWRKEENTWEAIVEKINTSDPSDYLERMEQEENLFELLEAAENQIEQLRRKAVALWDGMGIPESATRRNEKRFWSDPSHSVKDKFPLIFN